MLNESARYMIAGVAEHRWRPAPGRTLDVAYCGMCLNPIFHCEHDSQPGEETIRVKVCDQPERICERCDEMRHEHPAVFEWVGRVLWAHCLAHHPEET